MQSAKCRVQSLLLLTIAIIIVSLLVGCAKVVDVKEEVVQVQIVDSYYKPQWTQLVPIGKTFTTIVYPAQYSLTVRYQTSYSAYVAEFQNYAEHYNRENLPIQETITVF